MGQTNVFPTAETVDPITGMPVSSNYDGREEPTDMKRLAAIVIGVFLVGLLVMGLLYMFLLRPSGGEASGGGTTGELEVTATYTGPVDPACQDLGDALTAEGLSTSVSQRLNDVAAAKNLEENEAYFEQLAKDIKPIMQQYQSACVNAVSAGDAPEFYRTFVTTFQEAVTDAATVSSTALAEGGAVSPEDAERLRSQSSTLNASAKAVVTVSGGPTAEVPTPSPTVSPTASASS